MPGDAFNRAEVASVACGPKDRYVVSLIVGVGGGEAATPEAALAAVLEATRGPGRALTTWHIHDRETGLTEAYVQGSFDPRAFSAPGGDIDPEDV